MRQFFLFLLIAILPFSSFAEGFESQVKELIVEKIGNQLSFEVMFDSETKLKKIIGKEDSIKDIVLSYFSAETRSFKVVTIFEKDEKIELFGKFEAYFEVPVSTRMIRFGEELNSSDIRITKVRKLKPGQSVVKDAAMLAGMQAKYNIPAAQVIKLADLKKSPIIKENDPVTLLYRAHDISLKTLGIALSSGAVGEKIRVKNEKTGIVVFGEIVDKNIVKVSESDGE